jgi:ABC-type uncharacterized transport system auxiliary subunit
VEKGEKKMKKLFLFLTNIIVLIGCFSGIISAQGYQLTETPYKMAKGRKNVDWLHSKS